ncbi:hypothetical protein [Alistipes timonensis]|uniref:hypothetical protein n=1 Tax=Alistipes timonensis TaxID=1465754 RepID=UPI0026707243|nr:hypothetical protein [Alistipes timonensis]
MKYLLFFGAIFLILFYIFLRWVVCRTPVTKDDEKGMRRISPPSGTSQREVEFPVGLTNLNDQ